MSCMVDYEDSYMYYLQLACGSLSFLSSLFIIFCYLFINKIRIYSFKLVFYLSISELLASSEYFIPLPILLENPMICTGLAVLINSAQLGSVVWITCIATTLYQVILNSVENYEKYEASWVVLAWIFTPLINSVPIFTSSYGMEGDSCTYTQDFTGSIYRVCLYYAPAWLMICIILICYYKIFAQIRELNIVHHHQRLMNRLFIYPIIMIINIALLTCVRVLHFFLGNCTSMAIDIIVHLITSLTGFCNVVVFICTPLIGQVLLDSLKSSYKTKTGEELEEISSSINLLCDSIISSRKSNPNNKEVSNI